MPEPEYDPITCITAGELRARGINVPLNIPDCAWVPRDSLQIGEPRTRVEGDRGIITIDFVYREPFRWLELEFTISKEDKP